MGEEGSGRRAGLEEEKIAGAAPVKPSSISLGGDRTTRTWSTAVFEWLDDDKVLVAPPPSIEVPPRKMHVEGQPEGGEGVPEQ